MDRYLLPAEQTALLNAARWTNTPTAQRDYHLFSALILSGCRIGEFLTINVGQALAAVMGNKDYLFIPRENRKGQYTDIKIYLTKPLRTHLTALLDRHGESAEAVAPLVFGRGGQPLTVRAVQKRVKHWAKQAGIQTEVSPHWFRHTHAMNLMRTSTAKNPLQVVQRSLGQLSISSASIYAHATREEVQADLDRAAQALEVGVTGKKRVTLAQLRRAYVNQMEAVA